MKIVCQSSCFFKTSVNQHFCNPAYVKHCYWISVPRCTPDQGCREGDWADREGGRVGQFDLWGERCPQTLCHMEHLWQSGNNHSSSQFHCHSCDVFCLNFLKLYPLVFRLLLFLNCICCFFRVGVRLLKERRRTRSTALWCLKLALIHL